jgi:hypothetical protein
LFPFSKFSVNVVKPGGAAVAAPANRIPVAKTIEIIVRVIPIPPSLQAR